MLILLPGDYYYCLLQRMPSQVGPLQSGKVSVNEVNDIQVNNQVFEPLVLLVTVMQSYCSLYQYQWVLGLATVHYHGNSPRVLCCRDRNYVNRVAGLVDDSLVALGRRSESYYYSADVHLTGFSLVALRVGAENAGGGLEDPQG